MKDDSYSLRNYKWRGKKDSEYINGDNDYKTVSHSEEKKAIETTMLYRTAKQLIYHLYYLYEKVVWFCLRTRIEIKTFMSYQ